MRLLGDFAGQIGVAMLGDKAALTDALLLYLPLGHARVFADYRLKFADALEET